MARRVAHRASGWRGRACARECLPRADAGTVKQQWKTRGRRGMARQSGMDDGATVAADADDIWYNAAQRGRRKSALSLISLFQQNNVSSPP